MTDFTIININYILLFFIFIFYITILEAQMHCHFQILLRQYMGLCVCGGGGEWYFLCFITFIAFLWPCFWKSIEGVHVFIYAWKRQTVHKWEAFLNELNKATQKSFTVDRFGVRLLEFPNSILENFSKNLTKFASSNSKL